MENKEMDKYKITTELHIVYIAKDGSKFVTLDEAIAHSKKRKKKK